jgi:NTP pyrophosphatase (non-canonical NTP hydrolase)
MGGIKDTDLVSDIDFTIAMGIEALKHRAHTSAKEKGFWDNPPEIGTSLMLIVSELGEALEAYRNGNPASEKIPEISHAEEELADVVIRIMDFVGRHNIRLSEAILRKMSYNKTRPHLHGKKF